MTSFTLLVMVASSGDDPPAIEDADLTVASPAAAEPVAKETT